MLMQATVFSFDEQTCAGSVVLDTGRRIDFGAEAFGASGLRLLRAGQRVQIRMDGERVSALTIVTLALPDDTSA